MRVIGKMRALLADRRGATAVEYGLICALIVVAVIAAIGTVGGKTGGMWRNISETANARMPSA